MKGTRPQSKRRYLFGLSVGSECNITKYSYANAVENEWAQASMFIKLEESIETTPTNYTPRHRHITFNLPFLDTA